VYIKCKNLYQCQANRKHWTVIPPQFDAGTAHLDHQEEEEQYIWNQDHQVPDIHTAIINELKFIKYYTDKCTSEQDHQKSEISFQSFRITQTELLRATQNVASAWL
jgi:hypothetical protein